MELSSDQNITDLSVSFSGSKLSTGGGETYWSNSSVAGKAGVLGGGAISYSETNSSVYNGAVSTMTQVFSGQFVLSTTTGVSTSTTLTQNMSSVQINWTR